MLFCIGPMYTSNMYILENVPLNAYSTMRLGGKAAYLTDINDRNDIVAAVEWADERKLPLIMIGGGSNIIWSDDGFPGLVMVNKIQGIETQYLGDIERYITVGAGYLWDDFVGYCVERNLTGIEFLSLIPGTVGATPIQNVGAYGQEVKDTIATIQAYDRQEHRFVVLTGSDCAFGYRTSRFKTTDRGRFLISAVTFFLTQGNPTPPFYGGIQQYLDERGITAVTPQIGREATIAIRKAKLPDPALVANNGSFFANPIINSNQFFQLYTIHPDMPHWTVDDQRVKIPAAWLLEHAGFKDFHDPDTGMGTWPAQPLVLVNEHASSTGQLLAFRQKLIAGVEAAFGITLEQEPELIGQTY